MPWLVRLIDWQIMEKFSEKQEQAGDHTDDGGDEESDDGNMDGDNVNLVVSGTVDNAPLDHSDDADDVVLVDSFTSDNDNMDSAAADNVPADNNDLGGGEDVERTGNVDSPGNGPADSAPVDRHDAASERTDKETVHSAACDAGDVTRHSVDDFVSYEWSLNVSSSESEDDHRTVKGFSPC